MEVLHGARGNDAINFWAAGFERAASSPGHRTAGPMAVVRWTKVALQRDAGAAFTDLTGGST